ncbi:hypothetical protein RJ639_018714 [Escallonia herrerae]|uniref:Subtilisin-like protease fibronectin type-III domain-containing protein n=1 Tax=Escallonia herrerae TaxID=1293975 RepID=A0AA88VBK1_9ASTE|nr:hypothetical protein RJ639_018714 [Escallonia herrerae]
MDFVNKGQKQRYAVRILAEKVAVPPGNMMTELGKLSWTDGKHQVTSPVEAQTLQVAPSMYTSSSSSPFKNTISCGDFIGQNRSYNRSDSEFSMNPLQRTSSSLRFLLDAVTASGSLSDGSGILGRWPLNRYAMPNSFLGYLL